jgi:hypothetical protein
MNRTNPFSLPIAYWVSCLLGLCLSAVTIRCHAEEASQLAPQPVKITAAEANPTTSEGAFTGELPMITRPSLP